MTPSMTETDVPTAILSASPLPPVAAPEGWNLAPIKMNDAMLEAARNTLPGPCDICDADIEDIYETALQAAPLPPAVGADRTQQVLDDAATAIKIHDGVLRLKAERDAAFSNGVGAAADLIESKVRDYTAEHGLLDPETGVMEFSRSGEEYVSTLEELAEEIRAISGPVDQSALSAAVAVALAQAARIPADLAENGEQIKLHMGELSAQEMRSVKAILRFVSHAIRSGQGGQDAA